MPPDTGRYTLRARRHRLDREADDVLAEERARAGDLGGATGESRNRYLSALEGFDPGAAARQAGGALATQAIEDFEAADARHRQFANRSGVLHGASRHAGANQLRKHLGRSFAGLGMETARMDFARRNAFGDVFQMDVGREESSRNRYLDLFGGERDRVTAEENARRMADAQDRPWWQDALEVGGKVASFFV